MKTNPDIRTVALTRAITLLNSLGAKYKIILPDGAEHGTLKVMPEDTTKRRQLQHPYGTYTTYLRPQLEGMQVGDVRDVPRGGFELLDLQRSIASLTGREWGNGSTMTMIHNDRGVVEVMRVS